MLNINQTSLNKPLSQFVTFRDGMPDPEYNDALIQAERRESLHEAARMVLDVTKRNVATMIIKLGSVTLEAVEELVQASN